jgi:hypothetical protein
MDQFLRRESTEIDERLEARHLQRAMEHVKGCTSILFIVVSAAMGSQAVAAVELLPATGFVRLHGESAGCPSTTSIERRLDQLLVHQDETPVDVDIVDLGARHEVRVLGRARAFDDPRRRCEERAATAAVFLALALGSRPQRASPVATITPPSLELHATPPVTTNRALGVELEATAALAVGAQGGELAGGGAVRLRLHARVLGATLGIGGDSPAMLTVGGTHARLVRVPVDMGVLARWSSGRHEVGGELGLYAAAVLLAGVDQIDPQQATRVEGGLRIAAHYRYWIWPRVAPVVGLDGLLSFRPTQLAIASLGTVGTTPRLWISAFFGVAVGLR